MLVIGSKDPSLEEKLLCVEAVTRLVDEGWTVAAHGESLVGQLVRRSATKMGGVFVDPDRQVSWSRTLPISRVSLGQPSLHAEVGGGLG